MNENRQRYTRAFSDEEPASANHLDTGRLPVRGEGRSFKMHTKYGLDDAKCYCC